MVESYVERMWLPNAILPPARALGIRELADLWEIRGWTHLRDSRRGEVEHAQMGGGVT
jgi:hypothetical protein